MRARINKYVTYIEEEYWQTYTNQPLPTVLLIFSDESSKGSIAKFIIQKFSDVYTADLNFFLTTKDAIITHGLQGNIWRKVKKSNY